MATMPVMFDTNQWALSPDAQTALRAFARKLKRVDKNVYLQIVGHGDPQGSAMHNRELGARRALQVQRYLSDQGVPLSRMDVASWDGTTIDDAEDWSPAALQHSRRVDLVVLV